MNVLSNGESHITGSSFNAARERHAPQWALSGNERRVVGLVTPTTLPSAPADSGIGSSPSSRFPRAGRKSSRSRPFRPPPAEFPVADLTSPRPSMSAYSDDSYPRTRHPETESHNTFNTFQISELRFSTGPLLDFPELDLLSTGPSATADCGIATGSDVPAEEIDEADIPTSPENLASLQQQSDPITWHDLYADDWDSIRSTLNRQNLWRDDISTPDENRSVSHLMNSPPEMTVPTNTPAQSPPCIKRTRNYTQQEQRLLRFRPQATSARGGKRSSSAPPSCSRYTLRGEGGPGVEFSGGRGREKKQS